MKKLAILLTASATLAISGPVFASSDGSTTAPIMSSGLVIPQMDAAAGRELFATKGCVVCHAINGVGGEDAPMLDAEFMDSPMNPFDFAARMWDGAEAMVALQREELGDVISLEGDELAAIIAFVHDPVEQAKFSEEDIPEDIKELIAHGEEEDDDHAEEEDDDHAEEEDDDHAEEEEEEGHD